jgi:hypothetical protein
MLLQSLIGDLQPRRFLAMLDDEQIMAMFSRTARLRRSLKCEPVKMTNGDRRRTDARSTLASWFDTTPMVFKPAIRISNIDQTVIDRCWEMIGHESVCENFENKFVDEDACENVEDNVVDEVICDNLENNIVDQFDENFRQTDEPEMEMPSDWEGMNALFHRYVGYGDLAKADAAARTACLQHLRAWVAHHRITQSGVNVLLGILRIEDVRRIEESCNGSLVDT